MAATWRYKRSGSKLLQQQQQLRRLIRLQLLAMLIQWMRQMG
jgi:hypothetical protein